MKTTHGHSDGNGRRISGDNLSEFCGEIARQNEAVSTLDWTRTARSVGVTAGLEWTPAGHWTTVAAWGAVTIRGSSIRPPSSTIGGEMHYVFGSSVRLSVCPFVRPLHLYFACHDMCLLSGGIFVKLEMSFDLPFLRLAELTNRMFNIEQKTEDASKTSYLLT